MIFISHRGNIFTKNPETENHPLQIETCIKNNYQVEIDIRYIDNKWYLGHDNPEHIVSIEWLLKLSNYLWIHCKDIHSLTECSKYSILNYFWHDQDNYTLTSKNIIWSYPGTTINKKTICVLPETINDLSLENLKLCYGICSDSIDYYRRNLYV